MRLLWAGVATFACAVSSAAAVIDWYGPNREAAFHRDAARLGGTYGIEDFERFRRQQNTANLDRGAPFVFSSDRMPAFDIRTTSDFNESSGFDFNFIDVPGNRTLGLSEPLLNPLSSNVLIGGLKERNGRADRITFVFDTPILAFGAEWAGLNDDGRARSEFVVMGQTFVPRANDSRSAAPDFFGVISDTPFSRFTIRRTENNEGFGVDNIEYVSAPPPPQPPPPAPPPPPTPVPLPASGLLLIAALAGLAARRGRGD